MKYLVLILVVLAVLWLLRSKRPSVPPPKGGTTKLPAAEDMVSCAHCGLHFPASEAVHADGHDYCSPGHVRLPPK